MLHQLDGGRTREIGRSSLSTVVHNRHLDAGVLLEVSHRDRGVDWVEVPADILVGRLVLRQELSIILQYLGVVCDLARLHLQGIGVSPELALRVEAVEHLPVHGDVFALVVADWNSI